jgi:hypothetical protein
MAATTLGATKGRLIRCTVPGSTPNRLAMTRTPARPGVARASRISFFECVGNWGPPEALSFTSGPRKPGADSFCNHRPFEFGKHAQHLKHRLASGRRGVGALLAQEQVDLQRVQLGQETDQVLQTAAQPVHRPGHDHVEFPSRRVRHSLSNAGRAGATDMIMRNANTGALLLYDIANNQITGAAVHGIACRMLGASAQPT